MKANFFFFFKKKVFVYPRAGSFVITIKSSLQEFSVWQRFSCIKLRWFKLNTANRKMKLEWTSKASRKGFEFVMI